MNKKNKKASRKSIIIITLSLLLVISITLHFEFKKNNPEDNYFSYQNHSVYVKFFGEIANEEIFGSEKLTDFISPIDNQSIKRGLIYNEVPNWLKFEYHFDGIKKTLLIAKEPIMNSVSYDDILRAGAVSGNSIITDINNNKYKVKLLDCGNSTTNPLSEWNFLIGGIHEGDVDFTNKKIYSFIDKPYTDEDLKVGLHGSLTWCKNEYPLIENYVVSRGYFHVSRLHASESNIRTDRLFWRPVLELIEEKKEKIINNKVEFLGEVSNNNLFGENKFSDLISLKEGFNFKDGKPSWLKFQLENKTLLIAKTPVKKGLTYDELLSENLIFGERSIKDINGNDYSLRLLQCGEKTLDHNSEWNLLIGGISKDDEDFNKKNFPNIYSTISKPYNYSELDIGVSGSTTWCQESKIIDGDKYAVNRGYLTVSRFHLTQSDFKSLAFAYRPVLELK